MTASTTTLRNGKRDDLDRGDHLPLLHRRMLRNSSEGDSRIDGIDRVDQGFVDCEDTGRSRMKVYPPCGGWPCLNMPADHAPGYSFLRRRLPAGLPPSSTAAMTSATPALCNTAMSSAVRICAFLKRRSPAITACARMAPSALSSGIGPNFTRPRPSFRDAPRAIATPRSAQPAPQRRFRRGWTPRCRGRSAPGCGR